MKQQGDSVESDSVVLEIDVATLGRLLEKKAVSVEEVHSVDAKSKRRLHRLLLEVLKRDLNRKTSR